MKVSASFTKMFPPFTAPGAAALPMANPAEETVTLKEPTLSVRITCIARSVPSVSERSKRKGRFGGNPTPCPLYPAPDGTNLTVPLPGDGWRLTAATSLVVTTDTIAGAA